MRTPPGRSPAAFRRVGTGRCQSVPVGTWSRRGGRQRSGDRARWDGVEDGDLDLLWEHDAEDLLQREEMHARAPALEVVARTVPLAGVETDVMGVVVPTERQGDAFDRDAIQLASVAIRLLDLADERGVHR